MNYYTSDLHFGSKNAIEFDNRPFSGVEEMDKALITNWNARVNENDHVYVVGDFAFCNNRDMEWFLEQLKGHKHLILGNRDFKFEKSGARKYFESVDQMLLLNDGDYNVFLCHYPIAEWCGFHSDTIHLYGHIHATKNEVTDFMHTRPNAFNVGCMLHGYAPVTLEELLAGK